MIASLDPRRTLANSEVSSAAAMPLGNVFQDKLVVISEYVRGSHVFLLDRVGFVDGCLRNILLNPSGTLHRDVKTVLAQCLNSTAQPRWR